jgi:hypothetical protein
MQQIHAEQMQQMQLQFQQQMLALTTRMESMRASPFLSSPPRVVTASREGVGTDDLSRSPVSSYTKMRSVQRGLQFSTEHVEADEKKESSTPSIPSVSVGVDGMKLKDILSVVPKYVEPFYADSTKDKGRTVVQFLDNINTVMNTFFTDPNSPHHLTVVRLQLRDGASRWLQAKEMELKQAAMKEGRDLTQRPLSWQDEVEEEFVRAHLGTDLPELWLAQLRALQLGRGKTRTPIELDSQFDALARHVYPTHTTAEMEGSMLLAETYGGCVASGQPQLFDRIMEIHTPSTLKEWKIALTKQWNAAERVKARKASQSSSSGQGYRASSEGVSSWRGGRGGRGWHQPSSGMREPALNAVTIEAQGEGYTVEGVPDAELNAAGIEGGQRGVRRGGRGGGRGGQAGGDRGPSVKRDWSKVICYRCGQAGHVAKTCPAPAPSSANQSSTNQSNE